MPKSATPGAYSLNLILSGPNGGKTIPQDFLWGVLALNFDKSVYLENETADISMSVLNSLGASVCDAEVSLSVKGPKQISNYSTVDNTISTGKSCQVYDSHIDPDYQAQHTLAGVGKYRVELTAKSSAGVYKVVDYIDVASELPIQIKRIGPTRVFPPVEYLMTMEVTAQEAFVGTVTEMVPDSFKVFGPVTDRQELDSKEVVGSQKKITWKVWISAGETVKLGYRFKVPDISPEFYLLGPAKALSEQAKNLFTEGRQWQIAGDAPGDDFKVQRGNTVITGLSATITAGVDYVAPITPNNAFIRITGTRATGVGDSAGTASQNAADSTVVINNPGNIVNSVQFDRLGTGTVDTKVSW